MPIVHEGDVVLVRGTVRRGNNRIAPLHAELVVDLTVDHFVPVSGADIVKVEHADFKVGDPVTVMPSDMRAIRALGMIKAIDGRFAFVVLADRERPEIALLENLRRCDEPVSAEREAAE